MLHRTVTVAACMAVSLVWGAESARADRDEYAQETRHTLPIDVDGHISASTPDGHVTVEAYDGREVALVVRKRVRTRLGADQAEAQFAKMEVDITRSDAGLEIRGDVPDHRLGFGYGYSIDYELKVPRDAGVELRTSDGAVRVDGVQGKVSARTSDGDIAVAHVGQAELKTSDGSIRAEVVEGDLSAITSDGEIRVANIAGDAYIKSSDGDIDCRDVAGLVVVQLSDGDAHIAEIHGGISAKSSDGELIVRDAAGPVELRTSDGDIELSLARPVPMSRVTCKSSDGNIRFKLSDAAAFTVEARASDGRVHVGFPGEFHREGDGGLVEGHVNGGGPAVNLRTSDGSITIEPV